MDSPLSSCPAPCDDEAVALYAAMLRAENRVGGGEGLEGVYGSITRAGTTEMLDAFKQHASLGHNSVVLDIGSGLGRPLLHAIVHSGVAATYGIEVDAVKCQKAVPFVQHSVADMLGHGIELPAASLPKFICAPIEQIPSLEPATHIYAAWEGFARTAMESVGKLFSESSTAKAITIVQRSFRQRDPAEEMEELGFGKVKLAASLAVYMAGSRRRLNAYCFVRESMPKCSKKRPGQAANLSTMPAFHPDRVMDVLSSQASERSSRAAAAAGLKASAGKGKDAGVADDDTVLAKDRRASSTSQRYSARLGDAGKGHVQGSLEALALAPDVVAAGEESAAVPQHRHGLRRRA